MLSFTHSSHVILLLLLHTFLGVADARKRPARTQCRHSPSRLEFSTLSSIYSSAWEPIYASETSNTLSATKSLNLSSSSPSVVPSVSPSLSASITQTFVTISTPVPHLTTFDYITSQWSSYVASSSLVSLNSTTQEPAPTATKTTQISGSDSSSASLSSSSPEAEPVTTTSIYVSTYDDSSGLSSSSTSGYVSTSNIPPFTSPEPTSTASSEDISSSTVTLSTSLEPTSTVLTSSYTQSTQNEASSSSTPVPFIPADQSQYEGRHYKDSDHFRIYASETSPIDETLAMLEGQYDCFINHLHWRSSGLSVYDVNSTGPYYKTNIVAVEDLGGSAGVQGTDYGLGVAYVDVVSQYLASSGITCHEFGHALHYHQQTWVGQTRTGAWWETVANWIADTYVTSDLCSASREAHGWQPGQSLINVHKVIGDSFQVIVDGSVGSGNYYQAWPFLTFITNNPDGYEGLGPDTVRQLMVQYLPNSNEDPLHTLSRVASLPVSTIIGRYWARMAYVDIENAAAQRVFNDNRASINYVSIQQQGPSTYQVLEDRKPRYMGANIIPLTMNGGSTIQINIVSEGNFTATLAVREQDFGVVRYVDLIDGSGSVDITAGEEAMLVIANTPTELILYDAFALSEDVQQGISYSFTLIGAAVDAVAIQPSLG